MGQPLLHAYTRHKEEQSIFFMMIKLRVKKTFRGSTIMLLIPWPEYLMTQVVTRDLSAVANIAFVTVFIVRAQSVT